MKEKPYRHLEEHLGWRGPVRKPSGGRALGNRVVARMMGQREGKGELGRVHGGSWVGNHVGLAINLC